MGLSAWVSNLVGGISEVEPVGSIFCQPRINDDIYYRLLKTVKNQNVFEYIIVSKVQDQPTFYSCAMLESLDDLTLLDKVPSQNNTDYNWDTGNWE